MKIFEIGTGYTSIPAKIGAATEIVVEELTKSMLKQSQDVTIVDIKDKYRLNNSLPIVEVYMPQFFSSADTKLGIVHKLKRILYSISLTYKLWQLLSKQTEKVVLHFHNQYNLYFFLRLTSHKKRNNVFIAYTNHSYIWQGNWEAIKDTVYKRYFQEIYCCKHADKVFVLNEQTVEHLTQQLKIDRTKIKLIANGVNTHIYCRLNSLDQQQLAKKMNTDGKYVFFQAGSVCERKNQLTAIKLLLPLMKKHKNIVYIYAGGIISREYKAIIDNFVITNNINEQIFYVGELKPGKILNEYYNISKAFIFPSVSEGFSLVILEAMSAGLPVFVNLNSGLKLPNAGKSGCLYYKNEDDFRKLIENQILNEKNRLYQSNEARLCVENLFSWDIVASEYMKQFI